MSRPSPYLLRIDGATEESLQAVLELLKANHHEVSGVLRLADLPTILTYAPQQLGLTPPPEYQDKRKVRWDALLQVLIDAQADPATARPLPLEEIHELHRSKFPQGSLNVHKTEIALLDLVAQGLVVKLAVDDSPLVFHYTPAPQATAEPGAQTEPTKEGRLLSLLRTATLGRVNPQMTMSGIHEVHRALEPRGFLCMSATIRYVQVLVERGLLVETSTGGLSGNSIYTFPELTAQQYKR